MLVLDSPAGHLHDLPVVAGIVCTDVRIYTVSFILDYRDSLTNYVLEKDHWLRCTCKRLNIN